MTTHFFSLKQPSQDSISDYFGSFISDWYRSKVKLHIKEQLGQDNDEPFRCFASEDTICVLTFSGLFCKFTYKKSGNEDEPVEFLLNLKHRLF